MKKQVYNPFLPIYECVPDGEPHVFGDRVYLYGSHDKEGGETFCMLDYTTYSAPVTDLSDWRCEGTIYRADQDPAYPTGNSCTLRTLYRAMTADFTFITVCPAEPASAATTDRSAWLSAILRRDRSGIWALYTILTAAPC